VVDARADEIGEYSCGLGGKNANALDAACERGLAGVELGQHASGDDGCGFERGELLLNESQRRDVAIGAFDAGDVGEEDEGIGTCGDGGGGSHFVGVDVVVLTVEAEGDGADDGDGFPLVQMASRPLGVGVGDFADESRGQGW